MDNSKHYAMAITCGAKRGPKDDDLTFSPASLRDFLNALAAPVQGPVVEPTPEMLAVFKEAWKGGSIWTDRVTFALSEVFRTSKLYTTPPAAQPAPVQEPVAWIRGSGLEMLKLENGGVATVYASEAMSNHSSPLYTTPPAAPVQEPVGCEGAIVNGRVYADRLEHDYKFDCEAGPLHLCNDWVEFRRCFEWLAVHATPPAAQRQWVGLTDDEYGAMYNTHLRNGGPIQHFTRAIEAKLKEKNTP